jgi:BirA family transcriptional regulator, biotin operon repressor / biotin---[acetyl-CoA-carboxylase] ligase
MELLRIYQTIDSTNKEAARLLASGENLHGSALLSFIQTDGRGQYGRNWYAEPGLHLAMSIILQPKDMNTHDLPLLSMKISLAIVRAIKQIEEPIMPGIKWPNDIYVDDKKLAGILIENSLSSIKVQHSIIGIGMNVNEVYFPEYIPNPVSLHMLSGKNYLLEDIATRIQNEVMNIIDDPQDKWKHEYDQFIYGIGRQYSFEKNGEVISAKIEGVSNDGKLLLKMEDGERLSYFAHELKWLK